jgi:RNA binding exosome subunit
LEDLLPTEIDLKSIFKKKFNLLFSSCKASDYFELEKLYMDLIDYYSSFNESYLKPDTIRYQTILLSSTLILIMIALFNQSNVKVASLENTIPVTTSFYNYYGLFLILVAYIFNKKAEIDLNRNYGKRKKLKILQDRFTRQQAKIIGKQELHVEYACRLYNHIGKQYYYCKDIIGSDSVFIKENYGNIISFKNCIAEKSKHVSFYTEDWDEFESEISELDNSLDELKRLLTSDLNRFLSKLPISNNEVNAELSCENIKNDEKENDVDPILDGLGLCLSESKTNEYQEIYSRLFNKYLKDWFEARKIIQEAFESYVSLDDSLLKNNLNDLKSTASDLNKYYNLEVGLPLFLCLIICLAIVFDKSNLLLIIKHLIF